MTQDEIQKIVKQAEFYLSEEYLMKNAYLLRQVYKKRQLKGPFCPKWRLENLEESQENISHVKLECETRFRKKFLWMTKILVAEKIVFRKDAIF